MPRTQKTSQSKSSYVFRKLSYKELEKDNISLGNLEEKKFKDKDTGEDGTYWNARILNKYDDGIDGNLLVEGPMLQAQIFYAKKRKTYIDKETGKKKVGGAKYSVRFRELQGELEDYVDATDGLREGLINAFIKQKYNIKTNKSRLKKVDNYEGVFNPICNHPVKEGVEDTSKPKQEYLDAYDGTKFYLPPKSKGGKPKEMAEDNYKDRFVEGGAIITMKPLIKYTTLYVGSNSMKAKKYLMSAVIYKVEKPQIINYQEDTPYDPDVNIEEDIMEAFKDMEVSKKSEENTGDGSGKEDSDKEDSEKKEKSKEESGGDESDGDEPDEDGDTFDLKLED